MNRVSEDIQRLLLAHYRGDEEEFRAVAWDVVKNERRLNHTVFANELERILTNGGSNENNAKAFLASLSPANGNLPKDKDKDASLIEVRDPHRELGDLILAPTLAQSLQRVLKERRNADLLHSHGMRPARKLLFCGPPGCGKTVAAEALAKELYLPLATVRFDSVVSSYLGETAANLRKVFDFARTHPVLLFFDEFDSIGKHRTAEDEHGELKRVVNSFLQLLDGFHSETMTIAATNHQGLLDPALWRRFDDILFFSQPSETELVALLSRHFRTVKTSKTVRLTTVARQLVGFSHADVERVSQDAIKDTLLADGTHVLPTILNASIERQRKRNEITRLDTGESPSPAAPKRPRRKSKK